MRSGSIPFSEERWGGSKEGQTFPWQQEQVLQVLSWEALDGTIPPWYRKKLKAFQHGYRRNTTLGAVTRCSVQRLSGRIHLRSAGRWRHLRSSQWRIILHRNLRRKIPHRTLSRFGTARNCSVKLPRARRRSPLLRVERIRIRSGRLLERRQQLARALLPRARALLLQRPSFLLVVFSPLEFRPRRFRRRPRRFRRRPRRFRRRPRGFHPRPRGFHPRPRGFRSHLNFTKIRFRICRIC